MDDTIYIELFNEEQRHRNLSKDTIRIRSGHLRKFLRAFGSFDAITRPKLVIWLDKSSLNNETKRSNLDTLSEFFKFGKHCHWLGFEEDPTVGINIPKVAKERESISDEDVATVLSGATKPDLRCALALMAYQGFGPKDVVTLSRDDIDLKAQPPALKLGKGSKARDKTAILHSEVQAAFEALPLPSHGSLFPKFKVGSLAQKVGRHFKACDVTGSARSLLWWYRHQVLDRGRNFGRPSLDVSAIEGRIIAALESDVPSAALCYRQAVIDLSVEERLSYRGVANELRAAVWDVLDQLAPDADVMNSEGFTLEKGRSAPTQVQKTRHILKSKGVGDTARMTPEATTALIEELVGKLSRAVYSRSSTSAHVETERSEVRQVKMYVDALLADLFDIQG